jgi:hypothetical protein
LEAIAPFPDNDRHAKSDLDDCQVCHKPVEEE